MALGIDPMSALMKILFVVWGLAGLVVAGYFALHGAYAWEALLVMDILSLWYL